MSHNTYFFLIYTALCKTFYSVTKLWFKTCLTALLLYLVWLLHTSSVFTLSQKRSTFLQNSTLSAKYLFASALDLLDRSVQRGNVSLGIPDFPLLAISSSRRNYKHLCSLCQSFIPEKTYLLNFTSGRKHVRRQLGCDFVLALYVLLSHWSHAIFTQQQKLSEWQTCDWWVSE